MRQVYEFHTRKEERLTNFFPLFSFGSLTVSMIFLTNWRWLTIIVSMPRMIGKSIFS